LILTSGETIRLIGVDTPEFKNKKRNKKNAKRLGIGLKLYQSYAKKAKAFLAGLLEESNEEKKVRVEFDKINEKIDHQDRYGRTLGYVYAIFDYPPNLELLFPPGHVIVNWNEIFVNATLVKSGYGLAYRRFGFKHKKKFVEYEEEAREAERGFWKSYR